MAGSHQIDHEEEQAQKSTPASWPQHAAQVKRPYASPRLHAAFIYFKHTIQFLGNSLDSPSAHPYAYVPVAYHLKHVC
eukprot:1136319-Pelagomonas_calceolata.AAC.1